MTSLVVENLDALLALGCTALVISNNIMAIETMMILNQRGIRPHHDIDLIGYKDSEPVSYTHLDVYKRQICKRKRGSYASGVPQTDRIEKRLTDIDRWSLTEFVINSRPCIVKFSFNLFFFPLRALQDLSLINISAPVTASYVQR